MLEKLNENFINKQITEMIRKRTQTKTEHKTKMKHWWENSENPTIKKGLNISNNSTERSATLS